MTISPAKAALFLAALFWGLPAFAQTEAPGAPVQLPGADETEDQAGTGAAPPVSAGTLIVPTRPGGDDLGIEVGVIGQAAEPIGTLDGRQGGFGPALWAGTSPTRVQILLNQIPLAVPSPAMESLTRRLILSSAEPEADFRAADEVTMLRIRRAFEAGYMDDVESLINQVEHLAGEESIELIRARAMLLNGDGGQACGAATAMRLESEALFWMKLRAYCYAKEGLAPAARLTADLLYDLGDQDELFQVLLDRLAGNPRADPSRYFDQPFDELHVALIRDTGVTPPDAFIARLSPPALRVLARSDAWSGNDGEAARLAIAERAALRQAVTPTMLQRIYAETVSIDTANRGSALNAASGDTDARARATFASALAAGGAPVEQGQIVAAGLDAATDAPVQSIYAAVLGRSARPLAAQDALSLYAADMALASLASGDWEKAANWFDIARLGGTTRAGRLQSLQAALTIIRPSERFAYWPETSLRWLEQADLGGFPHVRLAEQLILFDAMGLRSDEFVLERLTYNEQEIDGYLPSSAVLQNLERSAQDGKLGETIANVLVAIGPGGPRGAHPRGLAAAISALNAVGLEQDARALAGEALIGYALDSRTDPEPEDLP